MWRRGKSLRSRSRAADTLPPATTRLTAPMMSAMPRQMRGVSRSPNTVTPNSTAVSGSRAPRMAVGVEPMHWMAAVVQSR